MRNLLGGAILLLTLSVLSCQKEINWDDGSNGDLLVKTLQITPATNDTNTITLQWDAARRLLEYKSAGNVNGTATDILHRIIRNADGTINRIISKSSLTAGFLDSTVYTVHYQSGTRLDYVTDTQYTIIGPVADSIAYTYNPAGYVASKTTYTDVLGTLSPSARENYTYDASGNLVKREVLTADGAGGFDPATQTTYTYSTHKNATTMAEESYIAIGPDNVSKNFPLQSTTDDLVTPTSYSTDFSGTQYNQYDRPSRTSLSLVPKPPGYDLKLLFYYQ
jgi:YD repeat-containing protein